jgi:DNA-3-methyladenine glycosylase II
VGACRFQPRAEGTHFDAIARAVVYQQLSGRAAATIYGRVQALYGGRSPTPTELLATPDEPLRAAGLSRQKLAYLRDLAARAASGELPVDTLHELADDAIIDALVSVKGVGRWTAQMFLMFRLGRPDVLPELDLGIRKAIQLAYAMRAMPTPKQVAELRARWQPYSTVACWYLWRSLELPRAGSASPNGKARATARPAGAKHTSAKRATAKRATAKRASTKRAGKGGGARRTRRRSAS